MRNEKTIKISDTKSIFLMESLTKEYVVMALYTDSAYINLALTNDNINALIETLKSFQKETV